MNFRNIVFSSSHLKVLRFLTEYIGKDFYDAEISRLIPDVSKASANNALRDLANWGISKRYFIGNIALNRVESNSFIIRELRKFIFTVELAPFIEESSAWLQAVYIFGDYREKPFGDESVGEIIFITEKVDRISRLWKQNSLSKHLNEMIFTPEQFDWFKTESPHIWEEVQKGQRIL